MRPHNETHAVADFYIFWTQSKALTLANLKCRYRKTVAGFLWVFLNPLISFSVQAVAFGHFLKIDVEHYLLFLISGLLPWMFIVQTLEMSSTVFVNSGQLIKSIPVSPLVFLMAQALDNLVNFIAAFILILVIGAAIEGGPVSPWLLLVFPMIPLLAGVFALSWLFATAQVFFRDTRFIVSFGLQACFFLTPIFYPRSFIPEALQWMVTVNPLFHLINPFQILIHDFDWQAFQWAMAGSLLTSGLLLSAAIVSWQSRRHSVYLHV